MPTQIAVVAPRISTSARRLAESLDDNGIPSIYRRVDGEYRRTRHVHKLINWGSSNQGIGRGVARLVADSGVLNTPTAVNLAANKLNAFRRWQDSDVPNLEFTTNRQVAHQWLTSEETDRVYCRTTLRDNSGEGIVVAREVDQVVQAPLYTKGVDLHHEFRFHVMDGVVFDGVRKAFRPEIPEEERNRDIMNHAAGTIFVRSGPALERASRNTQMMVDCAAAVRTLGLDFGAVDVLVDRNGQHHIIEVNTACGLEGTTLDRYTRAFTEKLNNQRVTPWSLGEFLVQDTEQTLTTTPQEEQRMNINNAAVGMSVIFNPESTSITTLTQGSTYTIERVGREVIYVRNSRGRVAGYQPRHFNPGVTSPIPTPAPSIPVGPADGSIDTSVPPTSPNRIVRLEDGTSVNSTGTAVFTGSSMRLTTGDTYTISEMLRGVDTGDVFLGVEVEGNIYRFISTNFSNGQPVRNGTPPTHQPQVPSLQDINNAPVREGDYIQVRAGAGGHLLAVGTLGQVTGIDNDRLLLDVEGRSSTIRIHPNRVGKITRLDYQRLTAEAAAFQQQVTIDFNIEGNNYRVASRDMQELHSILRRFSV